MSEKIAFIITVYKNDNLEFFKQSIESMVNQDYGFININIYLGIDGVLQNEISDYIESHQGLFHKILNNHINSGLAYSLNMLIENLEDEVYVFRMDSDDICKIDRVKKQVSFMGEHQNIDIIGGAIEEIDENGAVKMVRTYPKTTEEAIKYIPKASIFAHPTVCFRKSFFDKGFRYSKQHRFSQDLALWYKALANGVEISNVDDVVLSLRTSNDFYKRRSYKKAFGEFGIYFYGIKDLYGNNYRLLYPVARLITRLLPAIVVQTIYKKQIRKALNK